METVVTSTQLQKQTRDIIDLVRIKGDPIIVETYGKPMVVILSMDEYQDYVEYKEGQKKTRVEGIPLSN